MDMNGVPFRLHHNQYTPIAGFTQPDLNLAFKYPSPTQDPHNLNLPPNIQDHIHNDLNSTVYIPYIADWYTDFVTDVAHDLATQRVAVASAIPYQQFQQHQNQDSIPNENNPNFSRFNNSTPITHEVAITTPSPTITIFEHIGDEWRVQNTLPASHLGNIYKIEWSEPELGTLLASCSDDGLVHVYEEVLVDKHTPANIAASVQGSNSLITGTNGVNLTGAQRNAAQKKANARKPLTQSATATPMPTSNANALHIAGGTNSALPAPTPASISTQTPSTITSLLNHVMTRPQPTVWIRKSTFNDGFDPVVFLQWAPRHLGCRLATCSLDGKLRIYDLLSNEMQEIIVFDYDCTGCAWNRSPFDTPMILAVGGVYAQIFEFVEKVGGSGSNQGPAPGGSKWYRQCLLPTHVDTITTCAWAPTYGRTFHVVATGDRSGIVRIFKVFPRGYDGSGATGATCELLSLLVPYQFKHFHFRTHGSPYCQSIDPYVNSPNSGSFGTNVSSRAGRGSSDDSGYSASALFSVPVDPFCPSNGLNSGFGSSPLPQLLSALQLEQQGALGGNNLGAKSNSSKIGVTDGVSQAAHSSPSTQHQSHPPQSAVLYRGYRDEMVPTRQRFPNSANAMGNNGGNRNKGSNELFELNQGSDRDDNDDQFIIDSFLGVGFSISRVQFDSTGQLLSVVDDSGTTTVYSCRHDGFWVPFYSPPAPTATGTTTASTIVSTTTEDVVDQFNIPQDPQIDPYQYLRQQQMLQKDQNKHLLDRLMQGNNNTNGQSQSQSQGNPGGYR